MKKLFYTLTLSIALSSFLLVPTLTLAQSGEPLDALKDSLDKSASTANFATGGNSATLSARIGTFINYGFGIIGSIFLAFTLLGGLMWMIAGGNDEKVMRAKKFITGGIEGMLIIFFAYALVYLVVQALTLGANVANGS